MRLLLILMLFTQPNNNVTMGISCSNIPNDCKLLYLAITIKESGWHKSKRAIIMNNYSGFKRHNRLIEFKSLKHYIKFSESWFNRNKITTEQQLITLVKSGRYADQNTKGLIKYLHDVLQIKRKVKSHYNNIQNVERTIL